MTDPWRLDQPAGPSAALPHAADYHFALVEPGTRRRRSGITFTFVALWLLAWLLVALVATIFDDNVGGLVGHAIGRVLPIGSFAVFFAQLTARRKRRS